VSKMLTRLINFLTNHAAHRQKEGRP
jgi:hypothetical protein